MVGATVHMDMRGFTTLAKVLDQGMTGRSGPIHDMWLRIGTRYLRFVRMRFVKASTSPGNPWPDLADSTKRGRRGPASGRRKKRTRRKGARTTTRGSAKRIAILRDTGTLLNAMTIRMPGNIYTRVRKGMRVGIGGPSRHPKGKMTIGDIAVAHNDGRGDLPKREIIVQPDRPTQRGMESDIRRAFQALIGISSI